MPHRHLEIWLGLLGIFAVLLVLISGRNVHEEAARGGGRLSRMLRAGLALLGLLGMSSGAEATSNVKTANLLDTYRETLGKSPEGRHLLETWQAAREYADGVRGPFPFDEKEKKAFLGQLEQLRTDIDALVKARVFQMGEAALLKLEVRDLTAGVQRLRAKEMQNMTCYRVAMASPVKVSRRRLESRVPLIEKLLPGRVSPLVQETVIKGCEADLALLEDLAKKNELPGDDRAPVLDLIKRARPALERLRVLVQAQDVKGWSRVVWEKVFESWSRLQKMAEMGSTTAEREESDQALGEIDALLKQQHEENGLVYEEIELVNQELRFLLERVRAVPPKDSTVKCYKMAYMPPARLSLERLEKRLPLLKRIKAKGRLPQATMKKLMQAVGADLKTLEDGLDKRELTDVERRQGEQVNDRIRMECERLSDIGD